MVYVKELGSFRYNTKYDITLRTNDKGEPSGIVITVTNELKTLNRDLTIARERKEFEIDPFISEEELKSILNDIKKQRSNLSTIIGNLIEIANTLGVEEINIL